MTEEQFKANFTPGDIICRDRMGYPLLITAIGTKRFLYVSIINKRDERVSMIWDTTSKWRRWDPSRYPDKSYSYIKDVDLNKLLKQDIDLTGY